MIRDDLMAVKKELKEVKEKGFAIELLNDYKKQNKRLFIILIIVLVMWFATIGYLVYILNDVGTIQTTFNDRLKRGWTLEQALTIPTKGLHQKVFKEAS